MASVINSTANRGGSPFQLVPKATAAGIACTLISGVLLLGSVATAQTKPASKASSAATANKKPDRLIGTWRVTRGVVAPWVTDRKSRPDTTSWLGKTLRFEANKSTGPDVMSCGNARYESTSVPAEGMFQGTLTKNAKAEAMEVGVSKFPIPGTSYTCDTGIFEFHYPDSTSALLAMSNAIWTLDRSAGAMADATSPSGVVQRFLEAHFAGDMGFDKKTVAGKAKFISTSLNTLMTRYFAVPANPNEAPDINGDPFTNSQEYPTRFSVGAATTNAAASTVRVRMSDAGRVQTITYLLKLEDKVWRIDDLKYADNSSFRAQLTSALPRAR